MVRLNRWVGGLKEWSSKRKHLRFVIIIFILKVFHYNNYMYFSIDGFRTFECWIIYCKSCICRSRNAFRHHSNADNAYLFACARVRRRTWKSIPINTVDTTFYNVCVISSERKLFGFNIYVLQYIWVFERLFARFHYIWIHIYCGITVLSFRKATSPR